MIYNYQTGYPVQISGNGANAIFPAFYFSDDEVYFIYPADRIIYNYTLGTFFKQEEHDYQEITLDAIQGQMGNLIGYTQADPNQLPTLYYQNGRLTLQHAHCRNIGWHPRKPGHYIYGNILNPNNPKVFTLNSVFDLNAFQNAVNAVNQHNFQNARLIELYFDDNNVITSRHVSRSQLNAGYAPNFELEEVSKFIAANQYPIDPFE